MRFSSRIAFEEFPPAKRVAEYQKNAFPQSCSVKYGFEKNLVLLLSDGGPDGRRPERL